VKTEKSRTLNDNFLKELEIYRKETNDIFYALSRLLITLAVIGLTISPAVLSQKLFDLHSSVAVHLYVASLSFALISVFSGIAQHYRDYREFQSYMHYLSILTHKAKAERTNNENKLIKKYERIAKENRAFSTGQAWLVTQCVATIASLSLLAVVVWELLPHF
jgi:hypothetical protein